MTLRLIDLVLPKGYKVELMDLIEDYHIETLDLKLSDGLVLFKILVTIEDSENILDLLEKHFSHLDGFRIFILPVQASIPRVEAVEDIENGLESDENNTDRMERMSREELYSNVLAMSKPTKIYFIMVVLSSFVASVGVLNNNVAVIIGAMVIAPLLGPNMGLSLATVLKDYDLAWVSIKSIILGVGMAIIISVIIGFLVNFDPSIPAIALRTDVALAGILLAFASGIAGSIAFTTDVSSALIGVMVAVALLPPLAVFGLLLGSGQYYLATGAFLLFLVNLVCINLAGLITFYVQKIRPLDRREISRSYKITYAAMGIWGFLLLILLMLIHLRNIL